MLNTIVIKKQVTYEYLSDLLVTAVEGGINYWAVCDNLVRDDDLNVLSVDVADAVEYEENPEDEVEWTNITPAKMLEGLQLFVTERPNFDFDNYDAEDADCILQLTAFKEIVFG